MSYNLDLSLEKPLQQKYFGFPKFYNLSQGNFIFDSYVSYRVLPDQGRIYESVVFLSCFVLKAAQEMHSIVVYI